MAAISNITLNGTDYNVKDTNAQERLVSGTNIKTINNESILGSGNITIQGGSGGGETVIELTQAQYDALTGYAENTTYIITDAQAINMDDYATTADTEAIETDVATLSGSVANKADKANVSANSYRYFPRWNTQGIVTGTTGSAIYEIQHYINGANYTVLRAASTGNLPSIYCPTSAGTQNTILMSNGSGAAPIWSQYKFVFISQTDYDAIATKDSTTIYFIVGD